LPVMTCIALDSRCGMRRRPDKCTKAQTQHRSSRSSEESSVSVHCARTVFSLYEADG
jgi:hypothetical protein